MESTMSCTTENPKTNHFKSIKWVDRDFSHWFLQFCPWLIPWPVLGSIVFGLFRAFSDPSQGQWCMLKLKTGLSRVVESPIPKQEMRLSASNAEHVRPRMLITFSYGSQSHASRYCVDQTNAGRNRCQWWRWEESSNPALRRARWMWHGVAVNTQMPLGI
jgi:hypothetical protein